MSPFHTTHIPHCRTQVSAAAEQSGSAFVQVRSLAEKLAALEAQVAALAVAGGAAAAVAGGATCGCGHTY